MFRFPSLSPNGIASPPRSYGGFWRGGKIGGWVASVTIVCSLLAGVFGHTPARSAEPPLRVVVLGDSLVAGYGLPAAQAFPARLQVALAARGEAIEVVNAGVSGDTTTGGLARLDWSVPPGTPAVILELGANDMLRGLDPSIPRRALEAILGRLSERKITVLLCGMMAAPNLGSDYVHAFDAIYPELAAKYGAILYPFFLDGVEGHPRLNQPDGLHPTAAGVDIIVSRIMPKVDELIARAKAAPRS